MYSVIQLNDEVQISSCCTTEILKVSELLFSEVLKSVSFFPEQYHDSSNRSQPEGINRINSNYDIKNSNFSSITYVSNSLW